MDESMSYIRNIRTSHDSSLIEAELEIGAESHYVYFRSNDISLTANLEAFIAFALLPSMKLGGVLVADGKASERFLNAIHKIIDTYCSWNSSLRRVRISNVAPEIKDNCQEQRVGIFFSGGVDSFYTFLKHRDEITDMIFINGFDLFSDNDALRSKTSEMIHKIGSSFGKRVIEVETNLHIYFHTFFKRGWAALTHGAALASVGHVLSPFFKRIFIATSHTYDDLSPWGTHPLLDPLWSTEKLEFIHDGCEATRIDKVALLSQFDIALQFLRVCLSPRLNGAYNCGHCEKCLRTMINLYIVGALDRCATFNLPLPIKRISKLIILDPEALSAARVNLKALEKGNGDKRLGRTLRRILNRPRWEALAINWLHRKKRQLKKFTHKHLRINFDPQ
jgi:hypothetical protein